ncbi:MAG: ECF transporter S component [Chloroflexota bacterium]
MKSRLNRFSSVLLIVVSSLLGVYSFIYPFFTPNFQQSASPVGIRTTESPLIFVLVLGMCVLALLFEAQQGASSARLVALAGVLLAVNSVLRFIEVAIPGPGGFSPIFFLIILSGYIYGAKFGFLIGALTLFVSALITGGMGPWLPSQMFTAGWVGMSAAPLAVLSRWLGWENKRAEVLLLAGWGALCGIGYGAVMNLWSWPFLVGTPDQYWQPGIGLRDTLQRYAAFYLATSLVWDLGSSAGNVLLLGFFGNAALRVLRRFQKRFQFQWEAAGVFDEKTA